MKTIQLLSVLIALVVIAGGCKGKGPTAANVQSTPPQLAGPLASTSDIQAPAGSNATQTAQNVGVRPRTIGIKPGSVRITNTSGGRVLVYGSGRGIYDPWKPVIVHFDVSELSDFEGMPDLDDQPGQVQADEGQVLLAYVGSAGSLEGFFDGDVSDVEGDGVSSSPARFHKEHLEDGLETGVKGAVSKSYRQRTGRWRTGRVEVRFELPFSMREGFTAEGVEPWKLFYDSDYGRHLLHDALAFPVELELYGALPSKVVFHPVAKAQTGAHIETQWLQNQVDQKDWGRLFRYTPFQITEIEVGEPIIVDETAYAYYGNDHIEAAIRLLEDLHEGKRNWHDPDRRESIEPIIRSYLDFHVAIFSPDAREGYTSDASGAALQGYPISAISWYDGVFDLDGNLLHEMGHNAGMGHVYCSGTEDFVHLEYPGFDGRINMDGYRLKGAHLSPVPVDDVYTPGGVEVLSADDYNDFMSYCGNNWISAYSYRYMAEFRFGVKPTNQATRRTVSDRREVISCDFPHFD